KAERFRGLEIDDQFRVGGLLDRQVGRVLALEDAANIIASEAIRGGDVGRSSKGVAGRTGAPQAPPIPAALERLNAVVRSITSSLSRTLGTTWSTGFPRATSICGKLALVPLVAGIVADSCAYAAIAHAAAIAPNRHMNSRLFIRLP